MQQTAISSHHLAVLIGCEYSAVEREAFRAMGHDAWSCDLRESEVPGQHIQGDVLQALASRQWDLVILHPPCTHTAVSGARWFAAKRRDGRQQRALAFIMRCVRLAEAHAHCWAVEQPVSVLSTHWRKPDQTIQPWQFGHGETKRTCLWLRNLPKLRPTRIVAGRDARVHRMAPGPNRERERSRAYVGIAEAMAAQWAGIAIGNTDELRR
jgi:hypothetical protein